MFKPNMLLSHIARQWNRVEASSQPGDHRVQCWKSLFGHKPSMNSMTYLEVYYKVDHM